FRRIEPPDSGLFVPCARSLCVAVVGSIGSAPGALGRLQHGWGCRFTYGATGPGTHGFGNDALSDRCSGDGAPGRLSPQPRRPWCPIGWSVADEGRIAPLRGLESLGPGAAVCPQLLRFRSAPLAYYPAILQWANADPARQP